MKLLVLIMEIQRVFCEVELYFISTPLQYEIVGLDNGNSVCLLWGGTILSALLYNTKLLVLIMEIQRVFCEVELYFISTPLQYEIVGLDNGNSACLLWGGTVFYLFLNTFQASNTEIVKPCSANALKMLFFMLAKTTLAWHYLSFIFILQTDGFQLRLRLWLHNFLWKLWSPLPFDVWRYN